MLVAKPPGAFHDFQISFFYYRSRLGRILPSEPFFYLPALAFSFKLWLHFVMLNINPAKSFMKFLTSRFGKPLTLLILFLCVPNFSYGGIADGLTDEEKNKMFKALKKVNVRLTELETQNLKSLQETQRLILMEIQELQKIVPQMQGSIEQNRATMEERIATLTSEIEQIHYQGYQDRMQMQSDWKVFREQMNDQMATVRQGIAQDIETLGKQNQVFLEKMQNSNKDILEKVIESINLQNTRLGETQKVIKEDLIPEIAKQYQQNQKKQIANLNTLQSNLSGRLDEFHKAQLAESQAAQNNIQVALAKTEAKSQGVITILEKSFSAQKIANQSLQSQLNTLNDNQKKANENIITTGNAIYEIRDAILKQLPSVEKNQNTLAARMESSQKEVGNNLKIIDDNTRKIAEGVKVLGSNFNNLGQSVNTLHANVAKLEEQNKNHAEKLTDSLAAKLDESGKSIQENRDNVDLANQKLVKLIEILKTLVSTQAKIEQSLLQQAESVQTLQNMLPTEKVDQLNTHVNRLSKEQSGIKDSLSDLRRKANVNISRNDDIKKTQKEITKSLKQLLSQKSVATKP